MQRLPHYLVVVVTAGAVERRRERLRPVPRGPVGRPAHVSHRKEVDGVLVLATCPR
jgi:hypothetical protein